MDGRLERNMRNSIKKLCSILIISTCWLILLFGNSEVVIAGQRFISNHPCSDTGKVCLSGAATRHIDGFDVYRDCWEWSYTKTCNYPSLNNCRLYEHCYPIDGGECVLRDSLGNCVNLKREFSCKSWEQSIREDQEARVDMVERDGGEGLVCNSIPCIDGNCVDKSYVTNGEMMDAISKLYMASNMKPDKNHNFNLFPGFVSHCSKKAAGFSNCCPETAKGWGKQLGAKCSKDENNLMKLRSKELCVYLGKTTTKTVGIPTVVKHHFCCWSNMLEKVVQVEGRKQLNRSFGTAEEPSCGGLSIDDIGKLDFSIMDFSPFINELTLKFMSTYQAPNPEEIKDTIESHMDIRKYDYNENNPDNKRSGLNENAGTNSLGGY